MGWLDCILESKQRAIRNLDPEALPPAPPRRPVELRRCPGQPLRLIAEIKYRSPSAGILSNRLGVAERARSYERAGACMVSVLCDEEFFGGSLAHLAEARQGTRLPLLYKDFVLCELQLRAARAWGADAALLIVRCLSEDRFVQLFERCRELDLEPLVEVRDEEEAARAVRAGARLIGVNARDLDTLTVDRGRASRILEALPAAVTRVHLSGLRSPEDVAEVARSRADAALVGEALMREDDPEPLLRAMVTQTWAEPTDRG